MLVDVGGGQPLDVLRDGLVAELLQDDGRPDGHRGRAGEAHVGVTQQRLQCQRVEFPDGVIAVGRRVEGVVGQAEVLVGEALGLELERVVLDLVLDLALRVVGVEFGLVAVDHVGIVGDGGADNAAEVREQVLGPRELLVRVGPFDLEPERGIVRPVVTAPLVEGAVVDRVALHTPCGWIAGGIIPSVAT